MMTETAPKKQRLTNHRICSKIEYMTTTVTTAQDLHETIAEAIQAGTIPAWTYKIRTLSSRNPLAPRFTVAIDSHGEGSKVDGRGIEMQTAAWRETYDFIRFMANVMVVS
jgi:hypothetical protein